MIEPLRGGAPEAEPLTLAATDGFPLAASLYTPHGASAHTPTVLVSSATAVPRTYYARYARFLAGDGFRVLTYDYRGVGGSRPASLRGFRARLLDWATKDLPGAIEFAHEHLGARSLLYVGHSVGGQLFGFAPNVTKVRAAIFVAASNGWWGHWSGPTRFGMAALWHGVMPAVALACGYLPGRLLAGEDLPRGVALEWARWGRRRDFLLRDDGPARRAAFRRFEGELLAYSISDDRHAPRPGVDALFSLYERARGARRHVEARELGESVGHFGFFRERFREPLWRETADWLRARIP